MLRDLIAATLPWRGLLSTQQCLIVSGLGAAGGRTARSAPAHKRRRSDVRVTPTLRLIVIDVSGVAHKHRQLAYDFYRIITRKLIISQRRIGSARGHCRLTVCVANIPYGSQVMDSCFAHLLPLMGWSGRAPAPPMTNLARGSKELGARHVPEPQQHLRLVASVLCARSAHWASLWHSVRAKDARPQSVLR
jgi:hypothetical protein